MDLHAALTCRTHCRLCPLYADGIFSTSTPPAMATPSAHKMVFSAAGEPPRATSAVAMPAGICACAGICAWQAQMPENSATRTRRERTLQLRLAGIVPFLPCPCKWAIPAKGLCKVCSLVGKVATRALVAFLASQLRENMFGIGGKTCFQQCGQCCSPPACCPPPPGLVPWSPPVALDQIRSDPSSHACPHRPSSPVSRPAQEVEATAGKRKRKT